MQNKKEEIEKKEKENNLAEKMHQRLQQSYNIDCPLSKVKNKTSIYHN